MTYAVGSLVKARGREWVVLPESDGDMLVLRPLGGTEDEVAGIYLPLERVESAQFDLPDPARPGDYRSCRLLRDAMRLGFRSSAGPSRSFARIATVSKHAAFEKSIRHGHPSTLHLWWARQGRRTRDRVPAMLRDRARPEGV